MYKEPADKAASNEALKFFAWAYKNGGKLANDLDYVPMPKPVVDMVETTWKSQIKQ